MQSASIRMYCLSTHGTSTETQNLSRVRKHLHGVMARHRVLRQVKGSVHPCMEAQNKELEHEEVEEGIRTVERVAEEMENWLHIGDTN